MATNTQTTLEHYGTHPYQLGDLLREGPSGKLSLTECPICRMDPERPRRFFAQQESRPEHIATHSADVI
jgi:hypothetical protein